MRVIAALCLAFLIAGCASSSMPLPRLARGSRSAGRQLCHAGAGTTELVAADGDAPAAARLAAQGKPRAVILALHGFNDYSNAFAEPAPPGPRTASPPTPMTSAASARRRSAAAGPATRQLADDLARPQPAAARALSRRAALSPRREHGRRRRHHRGRPAPPATRRPDVDGVILVAPAVWGRDDHERRSSASRCGSADAAAPGMTLDRRAASTSCPPTTSPMLRACARDPLVIKDDARRHDQGPGRPHGRARSTPRRRSTRADAAALWRA